MNKPRPLSPALRDILQFPADDEFGWGNEITVIKATYPVGVFSDARASQDLAERVCQFEAELREAYR